MLKLVKNKKGLAVNEIEEERLQDIVEKWGNGETILLKKILGVAYVPTINYLCGADLDRPKILKDIEDFKNLTDKQISTLAISMYDLEKFKSFGDVDVTESLNYLDEDYPYWLTAYDDEVE